VFSNRFSSWSISGQDNKNDMILGISQTCPICSRSKFLNSLLFYPYYYSTRLRIEKKSFFKYNGSVGRIRLISGRSHLILARKIAKLLKTPLTPIEIKTFADGEIYVRIKEKVRGDDIFLIQSLSSPVNEHLIELLITIDALRRASAARINVVCPYLAYSRQDRKIVSREPISAKLIANLI
ncbi:unnamed protein product, partial [marine sediment metagenome]